MLTRILVRLAALTLLSTAPALAQNIDQDMNHDEGGGGCVDNHQVYPQGAEICQDGTLMRCDAGAWDEVGACNGGLGPAPISGGGDETDSDD